MKLMKLAPLLLVLVWMNSRCFAQPVKRNLLGRFSQQEIAQSLIPASQWHPFPQTVTEWQATLPDTVREKIIRRAEQFATMPFKSLPATLMLQYLRMGNRRNFEDASFPKREQLFVLALAESFEQKGRFADAIADGVWSICEESFWGASAHVGLQRAGIGLPDVEDPVVDLFAGETAATLAVTDYLAGKQLDAVSPLLRKRIYYEVNRRVLTPLEKDSKRYWYFDHPNNWDPWITSNWMISLLLLEKDEQRRAAELRHAMVLTDEYINILGADGAVDEGPHYWFAAVGKVFTGLSVIESATAGRIGIFKEPFVKLIGSYIYKTHIAGNYFISVADAYPAIHPDGLMLYRFGKAVEDATLQNFGAWFFHKDSNFIFHDSGATDMLLNFTVLKKCQQEKGEDPSLEDVWLSSVQLMSSRSAKGLFVAAHGGHNAESHNHNDIGDVILYADGKPVIIDVGPGTYVAKTFSKDRFNLWYNSSAYHNVPLINGFQQRDGREFEAKNVNYTTSPAQAELRMDIAAAYPAEAGIKQWNRTITLEKQSDRLIVKDSYLAASPLKQLTQTFMTICTTDIKTPGKITFDAGGTLVVMEYDSRQWDVKKEEALTHSSDEVQLEINWEHQPIWRLLLTSKTHGAKGTFSYTFKRN